MKLMKSYRLRELATAVAVFGFTLGTAHAGPILINGGFETDAWAAGSTSQVSPSGWTTVQSSDSRFVQGSHNTGSTTSVFTPFGNQFVVLCAADCTGSGTLGSISQTLSGFVLGGVYQLNFNQSPEVGGNTVFDELVQASVTGIGTTSGIFNAGAGFGVAGQRFADWQADSLQFTADATTLTFKFQGALGSGSPLSVESGIDNISIADLSVGTVPEPETNAMMLVGLGLLGFMARRRTQQAT